MKNSNHYFLLSIFSLSRNSSRTKQKPTVVTDYNKHILGVDKLDQLVSYYSFLHKSVKWWRKVFFWLLEVCVVNSFVTYKEACSKDTIRPMRQLQYRRKLIDEFTVPLRTMLSGRSGLRAPPLLERLQEKTFSEQVGQAQRLFCL